MPYFNPDSRSYYNTASHYSSSSSYYNDMYRSFTNLRHSHSYHQPLYISTLPYTLLKKPCLGDSPKYDSKRTCSTSRLYTPRFNESQNLDSKSSFDSSRYSSTINNYDGSASVNIPIKKREGSYESVYNSSRSSTPPNLINTSNNLRDHSSSTLSPSPNSTPSPSSSASNSRTSYSCLKPEVDKYSESNDLTATATSNIQLNCTDDLTTQVDYYLNEVDYRMICRGKQIELESFELSSRGGLISKCLYLNDLLNEASMNESYFETDPIFMPNGKATLLFGSVKDSEEFATRHSQKFNVQFMNRQSQTDAKNKKNVSFENNSNDSNDLDSDQKNKSILKNNSLRGSSPSPPSSSLSPNVGFGENQPSNEKSDASILVSANSAKNKKTEGYEILTIKAKLKQRVGQNRTKAVELHDIDSIMRNVVTIIQDEFMKRFPSGPTVPVASAIKSN